MKFLQIVVLAFLFQSGDSTWWYLSHFKKESLSNPRMLCEVLPKNHKQQRMCQRHSELMVELGESTRLAIHECYYQFRYEKWNCSVFDGDPSVFGKTLVRGGSREISFVQALTSASAVNSVLRACSTGYFACECTMLSMAAEEMMTKKDFKWRGCSGTGLDYSLKFVRRFIDAEEARRQDTKAKTVRHNNKAGRETFLQQSVVTCKCHGLSGSCTLRSCWKVLPNLRDIGKTLKEKYDGAIKITLNPSARIIPSNPLQKKPTRWDLVYYEESPDFCSIDPSKGLFGTGNRICNETSEGPDSCDILCCGSGYNSYRISVSLRCECTFRWCCEVTCKTCHEWKPIARCKPTFTPQVKENCSQTQVNVGPTINNIQ